MTALALSEAQRKALLTIGTGGEGQRYHWVKRDQLGAHGNTLRRLQDLSLIEFDHTAQRRVRLTVPGGVVFGLLRVMP